MHIQQNVDGRQILRSSQKKTDQIYQVRLTLPAQSKEHNSPAWRKKTHTHTHTISSRKKRFLYTRVSRASYSPRRQKKTPYRSLDKPTARHLSPAVSVGRSTFPPPRTVSITVDIRRASRHLRLLTSVSALCASVISTLGRVSVLRADGRRCLPVTQATEREQAPRAAQSGVCGAAAEGGVGGYSFVARLSHLIIDHASLPRPGRRNGTSETQAGSRRSRAFLGICAEPQVDDFRLRNYKENMSKRHTK